VLTPFSVAEIFDSRPSALFASKSPVHVTTVLEGSTTVLQPLLPADVANSSAFDIFGMQICGTVSKEAVRAALRLNKASGR
jgi:hypothetical protein